METCLICDNEVEEVCPDGVCRDCHVSVSWEDCCSGEDFRRRMRANGHSEEEIERLAPREEN
jgi:hypothetical protein